MFKRLLGIGPSIREIQSEHYKQAGECLHKAMGTNDGGKASRLWGEFCHHVNEAGYRGQTLPDEFKKDVSRFLTGNYDPLDYMNK
jgi:hypothetical protein